MWNLFKLTCNYRTNCILLRDQLKALRNKLISYKNEQINYFIISNKSTSLHIKIKIEISHKLDVVISLYFSLW